MGLTIGIGFGASFFLSGRFTRKFEFGAFGEVLQIVFDEVSAGEILPGNADLATGENATRCTSGR